jgi:small-conductance mechanosensitive channel
MTEHLSELLNRANGLLTGELSSIWFYIQALIILAGAGAAAGLAALIRRRVNLVSVTMGWPGPLRLLSRTFIDNIGVLLFALLMVIARAVMIVSTWPSRSYLIRVAASLAIAWLVINLVASLIRNPAAVRFVAVSTWTVAALNILGLLPVTITALDSVAVMLGGVRLSLLLAIKITVFLLITLWIAVTLSNFLETRINRSADLTPSIQVLIAKIVRISLIIFAILIVLSSAGLDLSALAIFSGAVGVGVGFGLQKIVSNFVSGIILLADKSVKPGDVVTVGDSYGRVGSMNTRYVTIVPRDGREILIPNEDLVTQRVTNWSYSDNLVRLDIPFGVSYMSDPHQVREVAIAAAATIERVLRDPEPTCGLVAFGESSLDFLLRIWIQDPMSGTRNVRSDVMFAVWDVFKREKIEFPYAVRDLRLSGPLQVRLDRPQERTNPPPGD